jgi:demethylmenaquinone methyltransferase/2-methoxy-6-polyprenyl-1,4-benzoquinol methylase
MLDQANAKDPNATLDLGDACNLPYPDAQFDAVTVGWGIRNVPDIDLAHKEACRVLKPGGRFVSIDMAEPESRIMRAASRFATSRLLPLLGSLFGNKRAYQYLPESTKRFMTRVELKASMEQVGFVDVKTRDFMFGNVCMHTGRKP